MEGGRFEPFRSGTTRPQRPEMSGNGKPPSRPRPGTLERATIISRSAAEWVRKSDNGVYWLTRDTAMFWDLLRKQGTIGGTPWGATRDVAELAARILSMYRELGFTPRSRHALGLWDEETDSAFAQLLDLGGRAKVGSAEE